MTSDCNLFHGNINLHFHYNLPVTSLSLCHMNGSVAAYIAFYFGRIAFVIYIATALNISSQVLTNGNISIARTTYFNLGGLRCKIKSV